jgi:hypothetical protein
MADDGWAGSVVGVASLPASLAESPSQHRYTEQKAFSLGTCLFGLSKQLTKHRAND